MNAYVRGDVVLILCALSKNALARFKLGDMGMSRQMDRTAGTQNRR